MARQEDHVAGSQVDDRSERREAGFRPCAQWSRGLSSIRYEGHGLYPGQLLEDTKDNQIARDHARCTQRRIDPIAHAAELWGRCIAPVERGGEITNAER